MEITALTKSIRDTARVAAAKSTGSSGNTEGLGGVASSTSSALAGPDWDVDGKNAMVEAHEEDTGVKEEKEEEEQETSEDDSSDEEQGSTQVPDNCGSENNPWLVAAGATEKGALSTRSNRHSVDTAIDKKRNRMKAERKYRAHF